MKTKNYFWQELEKVFGKSVGGFYDVRHGKTVKYRVKLIYLEATEKQLAEVAKIDGVVKVKNFKQKNLGFRSGGVSCVCIYLSKRIKEIRTAKEVKLDKEDLRTTLAAKRYFERRQTYYADGGK
jgi:hypothetical protein